MPDDRLHFELFDGTHSAIDAPAAPGGVYRTPRVLGRFAEVLGGQFLAHPPIAPYTVHVTSSEHPLVAGLRPFEVRDELYVLELHPHPGAEVGYVLRLPSS